MILVHIEITANDHSPPHLQAIEKDIMATLQ